MKAKTGQKDTSTTARQLLSKLMAKGFRPKDVAALLGRTPRAISYYLSGERNIPVQVGVEISKLNRMGVETLFAQLEERK